MDAFSKVSGVRWCPATGEILITAVHVDAPHPDVLAGRRGDLRLDRCIPADGRWQRVWSGYAHDPVCVGEGYAVHRGAGVTLLDRSGAVQREIKVGRFNWGSPALSVNYADDRLAWTRWVGDAMKPRVEHLSDGSSVQARNSVFRYGWWDDDTLVYYYGSGLRLLDVTRGKTRTGPWDLGTIVREQLVGAPPEFQALASAPSDSTWESFGFLKVDAASLWFTAFLATKGGPKGSPHRVEGLFHINRITQEATLKSYVVDRQHFGMVEVLPDGSAVITVNTYATNSATLVASDRRFVGPSAHLLADGWFPARESHEPSFAFQMPA
jgi:hypothetical protein